ncbi:outer membrane beta-barrel protein [Frigidibacter albus]|uniref:Outer membrane beta-barrel protein n=1 Tax=Frigidibacter albus TaxID=1465486 RepID=A0A6L8VKI4_9RHOB|nr:outer membrane beta-barrel protein [Frigidibacter albus]MZQ89660.1 outer membrane beta-barrel protein [Frigidibacter albus]NBE31566.1 outer membrane beta-barrel protein [Frigidibacter albus]
MRHQGRRGAVFAAAIWAAVTGTAVSGTAAGAGQLEISVYGGVQSAPPSRIDSPAAGGDRVTWKGRSFEEPPYYGVRATWWQNDRWGWGVEVNHAKVYADDPEDYGYNRLEFTDGINFVTANVFRRWQQPDRRITPYVGAGFGVAIPHVDVQPIGGAQTFGFQVTGPVVQLVAGASYALDDRWSVFGEYKGTWSRHKADLDSGGSLKTELQTNALNIGISRKF